MADEVFLRGTKPVATFTHRVIKHSPESVPVCADCGSPPDINWVDITLHTDRAHGIERLIPGTYTCPNGPHETIINEQTGARRG